MANKVLNLDFFKNPILPPIIYGRVGDNGLQTVTVNISRGDEIVNLTGGILTFEGEPAGGRVKVFDSDNISSTTEGLKKGTFDYTFPSKAFSVEGTYERAYFSFQKGGKRDTTNGFKIIVQGTADIDAEEAENIITEYNKLVNQLNSVYQNALNKVNSDYNNISNRIQSITSDLNRLQSRIDEIVGNAQNEISSKVSEAESSLASIALSVSNEINSALAELRAADFYNKFESDNKFLSKNDASIIYSQKNKVVDNFSNQSIDGFKNFLQTPTVKGKEIAIVNELPYEVWLGVGDELTNLQNGNRVRFGPELMTVAKKNGGTMRPSPLNWNQNRWQATITRDCKLFFDGQCRLQAGGDSGRYAYLVAYRGLNELEKQIGFFGGRGSTTGGGVMNYKQSIPLSGVVTFKAGDYFALSIEMESGKKMAYTQINHMHIMEII